MLPRKNRLSTGFFTKRRKPVFVRHTPAVSFHAYAPGSSEPRMAVVVPKKTSNKAVVRNKLKRHTSAFFEHLWQDLPCYDYVCTVRSVDTEILDVQLQSILKDIS